MEAPMLLAKLEDDEVVMAIAVALKKPWLKKGLPVIGKKVRAFIADQKKALKPVKSLKRGKHL
jgi:hypothetical protein